MVYCISDVHGVYEKYKSLLEAIDLKECDTLYVLGDVLDRGPQSMEVILDMMRRPNITMLVGNHEYAAMLVLPKLAREITTDSIEGLLNNAAFLEDFLAWLGGGGQATLDSFSRLSKQERQDVLHYLREASLYEEVTVNGQAYLLVHAGLSNFSPERPIEDYTLYELIFERPDYSVPYYKDKIVVTGHTPTRIIPAHNGTNTIFEGNQHIAIDCGAVFGGQLAAICLDTGEKFYV